MNPKWKFAELVFIDTALSTLSASIVFALSLIVTEILTDCAMMVSLIVAGGAFCGSMFVLLLFQGADGGS